jgi:hypothetical protein
VEELALAVVTGNISFNFFSNPHLIKAASTLGVQLPTRKVLVSKYLPRLASKAHSATTAELSEAACFDLSSDGWRKSYCLQGTPLTNVMALMPDKALFYDVIDISSLRKDADGIEAMLLTSATNASGGDLNRIIGFVLDNTKANHKAMRQMSDKHPHLINRGCLAHGLALCMKDFGRVIRATGPNAASRSFGIQWVQDTVELGNKMSNFLKHSAQAKALGGKERKQTCHLWSFENVFFQFPKLHRYSRQ